MASPGASGSGRPSSASARASQDSDDDDVASGWGHRQQVEYLDLGGRYGGGLSPQPSSSAECEQRVSPQDPNLSSAARYSPPPPYSSPMAGLEAALDHPDSPMEDLSHGPALPILPAGVSSSSPTAPETLPPPDPHTIPRSSVPQPSATRPSTFASANSLFSTQPLTRSNWPVSPVLSDDDDDDSDATVSATAETVAPTLAESVWAKQRRLALKNIVMDSSQPGPSGIQAVQASSHLRAQVLSQPSSSVTQALSKPSSGSSEDLQPGSTDARTLSQSGLSGTQDLAIAGRSMLGGVSRSRPNSMEALPSSNIIDQIHHTDSSDGDDADDDGGRCPSMPSYNSTSRSSTGNCHMMVAGEAEAINGTRARCEASSSSMQCHSSPLRSPRNVQSHISPLGSPSTPTDNCVVSSSTGHIDSVPPTPVEFQGNDVSGPGSPASPDLANVAILDSTVDSTSGRRLDASDDQIPEDSNDSTRETEGIPLPGLAEEAEEISTTEAALQHNDDSQDVALLVNPQGVFSSGPAAASRFIEQLSFSLPDFSGGTLVVEGQHSPPSPLPPAPDAAQYLDDPLAIPGPSGASRSHQIEGSHRDDRQGGQQHDQPSVSSSNLRATVELNTNLPLLDIADGLPSCTIPDIPSHFSHQSNSTDSVKEKELSEVGKGLKCKRSEDTTVNSGCQSLSHSIASAGPNNLSGQSCLEAIPNGLQVQSKKEGRTVDSKKQQTPSILGSNAENFSHLSHLTKSYVLELNHENSSGDAGKGQLDDQTLSHGSFDQLTGDPESLLVGTTLNLTLASSESGNQTCPAQVPPNLQCTPIVFSLHSQIRNGEDSTDGALLMMVSSETPAVHHSTISLEKPLEPGETEGVLSHLADSQSRNLDGENKASVSPGHSTQTRVAVQQGKKEDQEVLGTGQDVEAGFIGADYWCGECGQMYTHRCPHHRPIKEDSGDLPIRTRAWTSSLTHTVVTPKVHEFDGINESGEEYSGTSPPHHIQAITDKPVKSRAWASLPAQHLIIRKIQGSEEFGVFTRKAIPKQTQFGPLEGVAAAGGGTGPVASLSGLQYTILSGEDMVLHVDTSDEGSSNWMRFVRRACSFLEQNCVVMQVEANLFFLTSVDIPSRTELRVGYSKQYAIKRSLEALKPTEQEMKVLESVRKCWPCYECGERFETSALLQDHLSTHDQAGEDERRKRKRGKGRRPRSGGGGGEGDNTGRIKISRRIKTMEDGTDTHNTQGQHKGAVCGGGEGSMQHNQCSLCSLSFIMPELLQIHQRSHLGVEIKQEDGVVLKEENNTCPQCSKVFESEVELFAHVDEHGFFLPSSTKPHKCHYCYKSFLRRERLAAHLVVHENEAKKPFCCKDCHRRFCSNSALKTHTKFHMEGNKWYNCPICQQGFFSVASLKAHVTSHCINDQYKCPTCAKVFPTYSKIRRHIRSYHAIDPHRCSVCSKEMPSKDKLKIHMLSHSDRRDFLCQDCGKRFKRKDKLGEHCQRMHSSQRPPRTPRPINKVPPKFVPKVDPTDYQQFLYKCHTCLLGFKRRGMLVNHLAKRHPNVDPTTVPELNQPILKAMRCYYCQYCDKMYRSSSKRKLHILKYHPGAEVPPGPSGQVECEGSAGSSYSQTVGATKTYPHPCQWCYRQYASRARLLRHQRDHHSDLGLASSPIKEYSGDLTGDLAEELSQDLTGELTGAGGSDDPLLENSPRVSEEITLGDQLVGEGSLLRGHHLVNLSQGGQAGAATQCSEDDLLTQAMGEISPLTGGEQYVRLIGTGAEGQQVVMGTTQSSRPLLVSSDSDQQGPTLALVTTDNPDTVTLSLQAAHLISFLPGFSVASGASVATPSTRTVATSASVVNTAAATDTTAISIASIDTQGTGGESQELQEDGMAALPVDSRLEPSFSKAESEEGVQLPSHQPSSPPNSVVWQQSLPFTASPS